MGKHCKWAATEDNGLPNPLLKQLLVGHNLSFPETQTYKKLPPCALALSHAAVGACIVHDQCRSVAKALQRCRCCRCWCESRRGEQYLAGAAVAGNTLAINCDVVLHGDLTYCVWYGPSQIRSFQVENTKVG